MNNIDFLSVSARSLVSEKDSNFYQPKNLNDKPVRFHPTTPFVIKQEKLEKFDIDTLFFIFFVQQVCCCNLRRCLGCIYAGASGEET